MELAYRLENTYLVHNEFVYQEGQEATKVYFIKEGEIQLYKDLSGESIEVEPNGVINCRREVIASPANFGEENILQPEDPRYFSAVCNSAFAKLQVLDIGFLKQRLYENFGPDRAIEIIQMYLVNKEKSDIEYNLATEKIREKIKLKKEFVTQQQKQYQHITDKYSNYFNQQYFDRFKSRTPSPGRNNQPGNLQLDTDFLKVQNIDVGGNLHARNAYQNARQQPQATLSPGDSRNTCAAQARQYEQYQQYRTLDVSGAQSRFQRKDIVNKSIQVRDRSDVVRENQAQQRVQTAENKGRAHRKNFSPYVPASNNYVKLFDKAYHYQNSSTPSDFMEQ